MDEPPDQALAVPVTAAVLAAPVLVPAVLVAPILVAPILVASDVAGLRAAVTVAGTAFGAPP